MCRYNLIDDFNSLESALSNEWEIQTTTANASVPSGYRKIALTIRNDVIFDFHFYARHSDGSWSHKQGTNSITNKSFTSHVNITDSNISNVITEGGYDDGVAFFLIRKSAVVDYPHSNGHGSNVFSTTFLNSDGAGDILCKSRRLYSLSQPCRFDYPADEDCFCFVAPGSGSFHFTISGGSSNSDIEMEIYNSNGGRIAYDYAVGNPSIWVNLTNGMNYYIKVYDYHQTETTYTISYSN